MKMMNRKSNAILFSVMVLLALMALNVPLRAQTSQEKPPPPKAQEEKAPPAAEGRDWISKVLEVKYADVGNLSEVLRIFGVTIVSNRDLRVISVRGPRESVAAVEEAIKRLDVPAPAAKNIELTAYLLVASEQAVSPSNIPPELQGVIGQLRGVFAYQGFHLLETLVVRSRDGQNGEVSGVVPASSTQPVKTFYNFGFRSARITSDDKGRVIRIDGLRLGARVPIATTVGEKGTQVQYSNTGVNTDIDVREGQKVVVGKANVDGSRDALILVVTAKVVE
jgi:hypothetical protein